MTISRLPADWPFLSGRRTSVSALHMEVLGKKNSAALTAISQSWRKRTGQVMVIFPPSEILQTPNGSGMLSFVHLGPLLLKGQSRLVRIYSASAERLFAGKPNTSPS